MKNGNNKFSETKVGEFLYKKAPRVLNFVGDLLPDQGVLGVAKNLICKTTELSDEDKAKALELLQLDEKELEVRLSDLSNARSLQIATLSTQGWLARNYLYLLATLVILSALFFGVILCFYTVPEANKRLVEMFADIFLFSGAIMVLNFFFGSSIGSKQKTELMADKTDSTL